MVPNPSETELKLLRVLWDRGRLSARELHEAAQADTGWSFSATRKTLERMEAKKLVATEPRHGVKTYVAARRKLDVIAGLITDFAVRFLQTEGPMPAAAFLGSRAISPEEIDELDELLARLAEEPTNTDDTE